MSLRDPKVLKILLTVVVTLVVLWAYFLSSLLPFGYQRRAQEVNELKMQYETVSTELEKARRTVNDLPRLKAEHEELQQQWKQAESLLPSDKEVADLLTQITRAGHQAGVRFELFRPTSQKPQEFYNENPVDVQVSCGYHQLGIFLSRLANLPRLVNVSKLNLNGKEQNKGDNEDNMVSDRTLTASFVATSYSLRDPSAISEAAQDAEKKNNKNQKRAAKGKRRAGGGH